MKHAEQPRLPDSGSDASVLPTFIVFSEDWGEHPSSCQHLFRRIARDHRVIWVNTVGMRAPRLSWTDVRKAYRKLGKMLRGPQPAQAGAGALKLHVIQPPMLPFSSIRAVRNWNRRSVVEAVHAAASEQGIENPIVVSAVPNACDFVGALGGRRVVYYCVDDFTQWPGLDHDIVREMDERMIARADVLIATSRKLETRLEASGKPTHLLAHGVDLDLFGTKATNEHACLQGIPAPRAGYFGLFDERHDVALIAELAARMKDVSFVFTGPATLGDPRLQAQGNIHFTGPVPYHELPSLIAGLDVLFLPYRVDSFTDSISPLKLKEYLATGKPVVATPMAEILPYRDHVSVASNVGEWEAALRAALCVQPDERKAAIQGVLQGESWDEKARIFLRWCTGSAP